MQPMSLSERSDKCCARPQAGSKAHQKSEYQSDTPKLRAERKAGKMLGEMPKKTNQNGAGNTTLPALNDLGISKMQSSRWQAVASIVVVALDILPALEEEARERMLAGKANPGQKVEQGSNEAKSADRAAQLTGTSMQ